MSKYFSQGFEYSLEEVQTAANARDMGLDDYISFAGITVEENEPTDPPKKEQTSLSSAVDIFNQRKANLINEVENREPDGTLVEPPIALPEEPLFTDEEVKEFNVKFGDTITEAKKQRKKEITNTLQGLSVEGDSIAAPINFSEDMYDLQRLYDIGFEERPESSNDERIDDLEYKPELSTEDEYWLSLYKDRRRKENNDYLQAAILNENGKTPNAAEIFNIYNELEIDNANAKAETTVLDEVKQEGISEEDETFYSKVNDKINTGLIDRAVTTMNNIYGEEAVAKVRNAKTAEQQRKALRELRNDAQVNIYYDPQTGEVVNKDLLDEEEINRQDNLFLETADKFMFMPVNEQVKALKQLENKVAAMGNSLFQSQQQGNPTLLQALGVNWNDEKSTKQDAVDIENMSNTGIVPASISTLPNGGNVFKEPNAVVKKYNDLVETLRVQRSVVGINIDPTTSERLGLGGSLVAAIPDAFNLESLSTNEMANRFVYDVLSDELGKFGNIDKEDGRSKKAKELVERVGDRGDYYVGAMENIGSTITPLVKMSGEIMLWTALTGGTGTVGRASLAIGNIAATNFARLGLNSNAAIRVGNFTTGVLQESWGLAGSNLIGGTVANTDPMPVLPFAMGSQAGHLGFNWMSKTLPQAVLKTAEKNKYVATAVNVFDKYTPRVGLGAFKFAAKPLVGTTAIKAGELSSGIVDVAQGEMEFDEVWNQVTDSESFWDMYGSLLAMNMVKPGSYGKKIIENFHYDIDNIRTNQPKFNQLARQLGAEVKKTGSWSKKEVDDAKLKKLDEINKSESLTENQKADQRANIEFIANRLQLKEALDQVNVKMTGLENWNGLNKRLEATINSLKAGNGLTAEGITNIAESGLANNGTSPILELQKIGFTEVQATDIYKIAEISYAEGQQIFPDVTSNGYKKYVENSIKQGDVKSNINELQKQYEAGQITEGYYKTSKENLKAEQEKLVQESQDLMKEAEQARSGRVEQTMRQAEEVLKDPEAQVRELSDAKFTELKRQLGGNVESIGFGFQTVIDGKTVFAINKDKMKEYRKGSTLKHEIYHPVFERSFSIEGIRKRAKELVNERNIDFADAKELAEKEALDYIDSFTNRLKDIGIFEKIEAEMLQRPGYKELKESGNRNIDIEKEFINEFLELENEGALAGLTRDIKIKNIAPDALNSKSGADVVDYFLGGVERTSEAKEILKKAQQEYIELVRDGKGSIQTSEKDLKSLAKEYKEKPNEIPLEKVEDLIQQYTASGIDALKRAANRGQRKVPVNTKDPNVREGIADLLVLEFDSFIRNYDPTKGEPSTYMNLIAERILPKYIEKFKPRETTRIDDLTREIVDTKTPETELTDKESAPVETERLVSVFEGKEAKAKEKEIIEVFGDLRSDAKKLQEARLKGFGGTPKEELSKVAELLFNVPDGTKVSNPSKNVLPTINIVDSKGKKISKKKLEAGEKGIIEAKDFLSLRDYFKDKNNLRRFLNVSLPEYNVNTPQAIVNTKGEIIEVSPDVVGRGIRLPDRIYDYFYEQFIDPTGVMTSPSGRGKGKTSQVPKVYKIKPEFRKPSNEVVEKVSKDILADLKLSELPEAYSRNIAQLVKGMALVETMAVANQAKRAKLPAETAAEKQLIADIKSSSSKLAMSEKLLAPKRVKIGEGFKALAKNSGTKHIEEQLGEKTMVSNIVDKMKGPVAKAFGNILLRRGGFLGSAVWNNSGARVKNAFRDGFPFVGNYEAKIREEAKKIIVRKGIKNATKAQMDRAIKEAESTEDMKATRAALDAGLTMENNVFADLIRSEIKNNPDLANKYTAEEIAQINKALSPQRSSKLKSNVKDFKEIEKGKELLLDPFKEVLTKNPEATDVLIQMMYHKNSNSHPMRDLATYLGTEKNIEKRPQLRNKPYEEHTLPFGEAMTLLVDVAKSDKSDWNGFKKWLHNNYFQEGISAAPKGEPIYGYSKEILDQPVRTKGKNGENLPEWASKDQLHPELKKQADEAKAGKRKWEDVISADIRKYNEYASDRGYINPNIASRIDLKTGKIITDAKRYNVEVDQFLSRNPAIIYSQNKLIYEQLIGEITAKEARERLDKIIKVEGTKEADAAFKETKTYLDASGVMNTSEKMTTDELVEKAKMIDKALQMADRPNAPVKKIRIFDFDDTLAKTESLVFYDRPNESGKPVPRNKAIFMIGGPGSGKTNIGKGLQLGREGWKVVNQDIFIEAEKAKAGLPESEREYDKEQRSLRAKIGAAGVKAAKAKLDKYTEAGDGMVIDGTGASYNATMKKVRALEEQGYEVFMVHAKTSPEAAIARNKARKERSLPTFVVERTQKSVAENIDKYKKDFGDKFMEIDTETIEYGKPLPDAFIGQVKAKVYANERGRLTAEDFAKKGEELVEQGFEMDFSDFNIVRKGERGPLFKVAETIKKARGNEDLYVLTARAPESQKAIYEFLKQQGLEFKEDNIVGLGNSTGEAKANWIIDKAAEGFNDFYFADDAIQNVRAVKDALSVIDVKSKVQQARLNTSEKMNAEFNEIIEQSSGIDASKVFSDVKAELRGGKKKGQRFFIPPSAEDFQGLLYVTLPKGVKGEKAYKFYQDALLDPYTRAMTNLSTSRVNIMSDFKTLKKELDVPKDLKKETESGFTNEQAVRVYLWNQAGEKIPGLSKTDLKELTDIVERDAKLNTFAEQILRITKGDGYSKPSEGWANGTITTDLLDVLNTTKRGKYLDTWQKNVDVVFSKENLNKLEAAYGTKYREAVQNSLTRMKTGSNRTGGGNRLSNQVLDYINNSTGVTMFLNARSALLQTISSANYINWSFNNPYKAGKAFANQPQFWKDFKMLINSDYLKDRRNGLKLNISESEIANAAKTSKNKAKAVLNYLLEKGYAPTKYADSFAIAFGGASYYRNRVKDLMKNQGLSEAEASERALKDWRSESEKSQQSSDPSKISQQQASDLGRVVLQYVNTPMQYARLQKRDVQDIVNKRRMPGKTLAESNRVRVSRIIYYAAIQNLIFNAMQQGLFALGFGDTDISDDEQKKIIKSANGMLDSSLRGLGVGGVTVQVLKNLGIDIYERSQRGRPEYVDAWIKLLEFSPAIKSKLGRFKSAAYPFDNKQKREEVFEKGFALNNPAYESAAKVITATTNIPLDRVMSKTNNLVRAFDDDVEAWMSVAMIMGWPEWQLTDKGDDKTSDNVFGNKGFKGSSNNPFAKAAKKSKDKNPFAR